MSQRWLYVPVSDHVDSAIIKMQTRYENKYGKNHVLFSNPVMKPLKHVKPDDVLFIFPSGEPHSPGESFAERNL